VLSIDDASVATPDEQESTMTSNITAQAVSFSLALLITVSTLVGLNSLAATEYNGQVHIAGAQAPKA
jgi:hypothetical protein